MPVVWLDPFMHISSSFYWGNGTTSNTTRDGSYASPFNFHDFYGNSAGNATVNGSTLAENTEVKIKGKSLSDLTNPLGAVYGSGYRMYAATGNTEWSSNVEASTCPLLIPWNDSLGHVSKLVPTGYTMAGDFLVMWPYSNFTGSSVRMDNNETVGLCYAIGDAGYSASNPFSNTSYQINNGFRINDTAWTSGDKYTMFKCANLIKVSAGWVSETESSASGYSFYRQYQSDSYENIYFAGNSNTQFDLARFIWEDGRRSYPWFFPQGQGTESSPMVHNAPMSIKGIYWYGYERVRSDYANQIVKCTNWMSAPAHAGSGGILEIPFSSRIPETQFMDDDANTRIRVGTVLSDQRSASANGFFLSLSNSSSRAGTLETMNGATYYDRTNSSATGAFNIGHTSYPMGNILFSVVGTPYRAGDTGGFLENANTTIQTYNPQFGAGGSFISSANGMVFSQDFSLYSANWWQTTKFNLGETPTIGDHWPVRVMGVLNCNGTNYKGNTNSIGSFGGLSTTLSGQKVVPLLCFETNDYDQKPVIMCPNTNTSYMSVVYNETISGTEYLVIQAGGNTTGTGVARSQFPIEVAVPSHTAGTDNLRLKLEMFRSSSYVNQTLQVRIMYRKDDVSGTGMYEQWAYQTLQTISTNSSSLTTKTQNFTLSSSGVREINSVYVVIDWPNTTVNDKIYFKTIAVETY